MITITFGKKFGSFIYQTRQKISYGGLAKASFLELITLIKKEGISNNYTKVEDWVNEEEKKWQVGVGTDWIGSNWTSLTTQTVQK